MAVESVAECPWNGWPNAHGISGRMSAEFAGQAGKQDRVVGSDPGLAAQICAGITTSRFRFSSHSRNVAHCLGNGVSFLCGPKAFMAALNPRIHDHR